MAGQVSAGSPRGGDVVGTMGVEGPVADAPFIAIAIGLAFFRNQRGQIRRRLC